MHPAVLVIHCTGDGSVYDKILERVHDDNMQVVVFQLFRENWNIRTSNGQFESGPRNLRYKSDPGFLEKTNDATTEKPAKLLLLGNAATEARYYYDNGGISS